MVGGDRRAPEAADSTVKVSEGGPWGQWYKKRRAGPAVSPGGLAWHE